MANLITAAERELGVATLNVIMDKLEGYEVLSAPSNMNHRIAWCAVLGAEIDNTVDSNHLLFLLRTTMLQKRSLIPEKAYALLVLRPDEPFDTAYASMSRDLISRTIVVREPEDGKPFLILQSELLSFFYRIFCWKVRCDEILRTNGSMQDLITETERYTSNWIDVTDGTYSLMAYTQKCEPPGSLSKDLVELGCHSFAHLSDAKGAGALREWRDQTDIQVFPPADYAPYDFITATLKVRGDYYGHVVMICNSESLTSGLIDFFALIASYCQDIIEREAHKGLSSQTTYHNFLESLLEGKALSQDYIDTQCSLLGIEKCTFFKLVTVDFHESEYSYQPLYLSNSFTSAFPNALTLLYQGDLLLLFCEEDYDPGYDQKRQQMLRAFCESHGCICFSSGYSHSIKDISLLHAQARIAAQYKSCVDSEKAPLLERIPVISYAFEEAFNYYCCDFGRKDDMLLAFCLNNTLLDLMIERETDHDVSDVKLLYCYLCNERKATPTAELLHMHRNNILYRIGNIEKRYQLDLGKYGLRQYLLNCYRIKIQSSANFRKMLQS